MANETSKMIDMAAEIVAAYVGANAVAAADLPGLIRQVYGALTDIERGESAAPPAEPRKPAVSVRKSITPDYLISLEDGEQFKSLRRHLRTKHGLSPEEYRAKWGLPNDYPMVAPNYSAARSSFAKSMGLGQAGRGGKTTPMKAPAKASAKPATKPNRTRAKTT